MTGAATGLLLDEFDRRFRADGDPWDFENSPYEIAKRSATILACRPLARMARILELGAANGVLAADLAELGGTVVAVEGAAAAAELAAERLRPWPGASVVQGLVPADVPSGPYDLVVASEILYYLDAEAYAQTLAALPGWLAPGGRLVAVHWRPTGPERPRSADAIHADLSALPDLEHRASCGTDDYHLDVLDHR